MNEKVDQDKGKETWNVIVDKVCPKIQTQMP